MTGQYQTLSVDNPGAFNTLEWFSQIIKLVNFNDRQVIDWGCAEGVMTRLAMKNGARYVYGIDSDMHRITRALFKRKSQRELYFNVSIKDWLDTHTGYTNISILSMIIHWLEDRDILRDILWHTKDTAIVIWRPSDPTYQIPENGHWFPTAHELDIFMESCGFKHQQQRVTTLERKPHLINLEVYNRFKGMDVREDTVIKRNIYYDYEWLVGLDKLNKHLKFDHLLEAGIGYYKTKKLSGNDGFGENAFVKPWLAKKYGTAAPELLKPLLDDLKDAYEKTGLMFCDLTLRDLINHDGYQVVDFDHICPYDPNNTAWRELNELVT